jgi:hypothetical protein
MKTGADALGTAENMSMSGKHENETGCPRYGQKLVRERKTLDSMSSVQLKTSPGAQNMKTGPDALGTAENMFGSGKHEKLNETPLVRPKTSKETQNMKMGTTSSVTLKTSPGAQYKKTGPDALGSAINDSGRAK